MKDGNYYVVHGWMLNRLHLSGSELLCYAVIYGFSQDGASQYMGSLNYLKEWLNVSQPTVIKALKSLVEKGLIIKQDGEKNNIRFCYYSINVETMENGTKVSLVGGTKVSLVNKEYNKEIDKEKNNNKKESVSDLFPDNNPELEFNNWFKENFPILVQNKRPLKYKTYVSLLAKYPKNDIILKLNEMESKKDFNRKYSDVGRVLWVWLERDYDKSKQRFTFNKKQA